MKYILNYPEDLGSGSDMLESGSVGGVAAAAESAGFSGFSLTEHPIPSAAWLNGGGHQTIDPLVGLGFAAAATSRIKLLTYLIVVAYRNPFILAKAASTLDRLSGGRLILGVGTGYQKSEFFALGVDFAERNALMDEALEVLPLAWSGRPFSFTGLHFDARDVLSMPPPSQRPIPIWIGGNADITLRRVATKAQGWMPLAGTVQTSTSAKTPHLGTLDDLHVRIERLRDYAGDRFGDLPILFPYVDRSIHEIGVDVERHREAVASLKEVGVSHLSIEGPSGERRLRDFIEGFGETYIAET
jgi:probable F420-dependent oxidoreductase